MPNDEELVRAGYDVDDAEVNALRASGYQDCDRVAAVLGRAELVPVSDARTPR